jgi:hypothetical protein
MLLCVVLLSLFTTVLPHQSLPSHNKPMPSRAMGEAKHLCLILPIRLDHRIRLLLEGSTSHRIAESYLPVVGHGWQEHEERRRGDQLAVVVALALEAEILVLAAAIGIV